MSLKRVLFFLAIAFGLFFLVQSPVEAAKLVRIFGENAGELFAAAAESFVRFMKSLI
jgi:hypothetical protein